MQGTRFSIFRFLRTRHEKHGFAFTAALAAGFATMIGTAAWSWAVPGLPETSIDDDGRYHLIDTDGQLVDRASLKGRPYLVVFGYTACPEICTTMILRLAKARAALGAPARAMPIVFISIDPEHDTPDVLAAFTRKFPQPMIGLTGSPDVIASVADHAAVFAQRTVNPNGSYTIEHTSSAIVYDRQDEFYDTIRLDDSEAQTIAKLREVLLFPVQRAEPGAVPLARANKQ